MQTTDNLEGGAAPEFRETGIDAEMGKAKPSKGDIGNGREVPENKDSAQDAAGVQDGPPGSSPPESNSKRSEIDESEELERGLNQSRGSPGDQVGRRWASRVFGSTQVALWISDPRTGWPASRPFGRFDIRRRVRRVGQSPGSGR